jgi:hypothetical protein
MHTYPTHNKKGDLIGFEISNLLISRGRVVRLLRTIPTVTITKLPKRWVLDDDDFVHFKVNDYLFKVIEPLGTIVGIGSSPKTRLVRVRLKESVKCSTPTISWDLGTKKRGACRWTRPLNSGPSDDGTSYFKASMPAPKLI